ncbi:MAG: deoxyribonuclease IV [Verrucomicrobia bacterium]|nr:deoxyribonuclease IV [Verrucomicrobiota bacterium]
MKNLLIGAHTSAQGGVHHALLEGKEIGATTIQLFTANQKTWHTKPIAEEEVARWEEALAQTGLQKIMSHDSYLINLGSPSAESRDKSLQAFKNELHRCHQLKLDYLNFHPGAALDSSAEECLKQIVESLTQMEDMAASGPTRLLIEATAGQGSSVGHKFEHLGYLIEHLHKKIPIGVCIDTCHIFAAGYDIRTKEGWDQTLKEFDRTVGLKHLYALHLNDSKNPLGSRKDRHAPIGEGEIGIEGFKAIMQNSHLKHLPMYLETPDGVELWKKEIALLKKLAE